MILIGGLNHLHDSEGNDRADMKLPYGQDELIREVLKVNPDTIIVMMGGSPVEMSAWIHQAKAVVWNWYSGMEGGTALAEVLFGKVNPSGKLPETFYKKHTDCSAHAVGEFPGDTKVHYKEGVFVGYRYNDTFDVEPQFCFGHGLSYTSFFYTGGTVTRKKNCLEVSCNVKNTGTYEGKEIVQIYLAPQQRKETEPLQELKGFAKIHLLPGEVQTVTIPISLPEHTDPNRSWEVRIASSSRDVRLQLKI